MLHWFSFEIWKMITPVSWCNDFIWDALIFFGDLKHVTNTAWCTDAFWESGKCPQMRHAAVALLGIWKKFPSASSFTHFLLVSAKSSLMWCAHWLFVPALRIWDLGFWGSRNVPLGNSVTAPRVQGLEWPPPWQPVCATLFCKLQVDKLELCKLRVGKLQRQKKRGSHVAF